MDILQIAADAVVRLLEPFTADARRAILARAMGAPQPLSEAQAVRALAQAAQAAQRERTHGSAQCGSLWSVRGYDGKMVELMCRMQAGHEEAHRDRGISWETAPAMTPAQRTAAEENDRRVAAEVAREATDDPPLRHRMTKDAMVAARESIERVFLSLATHPDGGGRFPGYSVSEVATLVGVKPTTVSHLLGAMVEAGKVRREGTKSATRYFPASLPSTANGAAEATTGAATDAADAATVDA